MLTLIFRQILVVMIICVARKSNRLHFRLESLLRKIIADWIQLNLEHLFPMMVQVESVISSTWNSTRLEKGEWTV